MVPIGRGNALSQHENPGTSGVPGVSQLRVERPAALCCSHLCVFDATGSWAMWSAHSVTMLLASVRKSINVFS